MQTQTLNINRKYIKLTKLPTKLHYRAQKEPPRPKTKTIVKMFATATITNKKTAVSINRS